MASGIRAEIKIDDPPACVVAEASGEVDNAASGISKSVDPTASGRVSEEFMLEVDDDADTDTTVDDDDLDVSDDLTKIFSYGSSAVYRLTRDLDRGCPCELVEQFDAPVTDVYTRGSSLYLTFHAGDMQDLQAIIGELKQQCPTIDVQRLLQSQQEHSKQNLVFVDRSALTTRQLEVLETAHQMGYFEHPKRANAGEVADELGITGTTFAEHLSAAQTKLLDAILENADER